MCLVVFWWFSLVFAAGRRTVSRKKGVCHKEGLLGAVFAWISHEFPIKITAKTSWVPARAVGVNVVSRGPLPFFLIMGWVAGAGGRGTPRSEENNTNNNLFSPTHPRSATRPGKS